MVRDESGSEVVQFVFAVMALMLLLFGAVYVTRYATSALILSSELSQACLRLDTSGLLAAADKQRYLAEEIAGESSQLALDAITINGVRVHAHEKNVASSWGVEQRASIVSVSFDVSYGLPVGFGANERAMLERHVSCSIENERVSEVVVS